MVCGCRLEAAPEEAGSEEVGSEEAGSGSGTLEEGSSLAVLRDLGGKWNSFPNTVVWVLVSYMQLEEGSSLQPVVQDYGG